MNKVGMKKIWIYFMMSLGLAACSNEADSPFAEGMGGLCLTAKMDTEITIPMITKSADFSDLRVEDLFIRIYDESGALVNTGAETYGDLLALDDKGEGGLPIVLPLGSYTVKASTSTKEADGVMATPYFAATQESVIVEEKRISTAVLLCTLQSIGVELQLSEQFKAKMEAEPNNYSYEVKVSNGKAKWEFSPEQMTVGYFIEPCDELVATVRVRLGSSNDWYDPRTYRIKNNGQAPQLGEYYIITLDAGEEPETNEASLRAVQINHER